MMTTISKVFFFSVEQRSIHRRNVEMLPCCWARLLVEEEGKNWKIKISLVALFWKKTTEKREIGMVQSGKVSIVVKKRSWVWSTWQRWTMRVRAWTAIHCGNFSSCFFFGWYLARLHTRRKESVYIISSVQMGAESRMVIFSYLNILMASALFQFSTWAEEKLRQRSQNEKSFNKFLISSSSCERAKLHVRATHKLQLGANVHRNNFRAI